MNSRIPATLILAVLVLLAFSPARAEGEQSLKIDIKALQASVKNAQALPVSTKISNGGKDNRRLQIWSCSYPEHWKTDSASVEVEQVPCDKNALMEITLKPGDVYEKQLSVRVLVAAKDLQQDSVTFRLGFKTSLFAEAPAVVWSNAVRVAVTD